MRGLADQVRTALSSPVNPDHEAHSVRESSYWKLADCGVTESAPLGYGTVVPWMMWLDVKTFVRSELMVTGPLL